MVCFSSISALLAQSDTPTLDQTIILINKIFKESGADAATRDFKLNKDGVIFRVEISDTYATKFSFWIQDVDLNLDIFDHYQQDDGSFDVTIDCKSPSQCFEYEYKSKDGRLSYEYDRFVSIKLNKKKDIEDLFRAFIFYTEMTE